LWPAARLRLGNCTQVVYWMALAEKIRTPGGGDGTFSG
jgi:hypothetical protein